MYFFNQFYQENKIQSDFKKRLEIGMKYYCIKQHDITDCGAACLAIALIAIGAKTITITLGGVLKAVGVAWAAGHVGNEIYNAFK